jgi:molecular chaperone DnaK
MEADDADAMKKAEQTLTETSHKLAEVMYQQEAGGGGGAAGQGAGAAGGGSQEDVIEAEYVDTEES